MVWPFGPSKAKIAENAAAATATAAAERARARKAHINAGDVEVWSDGGRWGEGSYSWYTKEQYERYLADDERSKKERQEREREMAEKQMKAKIAYCQPLIDEALAKVKAGGTRRLKRAKRKGKKTRRA